MSSRFGIPWVAGSIPFTTRFIRILYIIVYFFCLSIQHLYTILLAEYVDHKVFLYCVNFNLFCRRNGDHFCYVQCITYVSDKSFVIHGNFQFCCSKLLKNWILLGLLASRSLTKILCYTCISKCYITSFFGHFSDRFTTNNSSDILTSAVPDAQTWDRSLRSRMHDELCGFPSRMNNFFLRSFSQKKLTTHLYVFQNYRAVPPIHSNACALAPCTIQKCVFIVVGLSSGQPSDICIAINFLVVFGAGQKFPSQSIRKQVSEALGTGSNVPGYLTFFFMRFCESFSLFISKLLISAEFFFSFEKHLWRKNYGNNAIHYWRFLAFPKFAHVTRTACCRLVSVCYTPCMRCHSIAFGYPWDSWVESFQK